MGKSVLSLLFALFITTASYAQMFTDVAPDLGLDIVSPWGDAFAIDFNGDENNDVIYTSRYNAPSYYFQFDGGTYHQVSINMPQDDADPWKVIPVDFDHDGDLDMIMCEYHSRSRYLENQHGRMVERTSQKGLSTRTGGRDVAVVDLNHDVWMDIIIGYRDIGWKAYVNNAGVDFSDVTSEVNLPMIDDFHRFCETDVDLDGDVDLFMTTVGGDDYFFRNNGGTFEDYTDESGLREATGRGGCLWADFDNDKFPDLLVGGTGKHTIWHNNGNATFTEMDVHGTPVQFNVYPYTAAYAAADYDQDGDLDVFAGQPGGGTYDDKPDQFFQCDSIVGLDAYFTDIAPELGMNIQADTRPQFFDYDRDGDLDLFLRIYGEPSRLYRNNLNGVAGTRVRAEGPEGEQDCWLSRVEVYVPGTNNLVVCSETNYGGARRDGFNHCLTLDPHTAYDLVVYYTDGTVMSPTNFPDLGALVPAEFNNTVIVRRGVGVMGVTPAADPAPVLPIEFDVAAYPNPFNAVVNIDLTFSAGADITAKMFDLQGRQVTTLLTGRIAAGTTRLQWSGEGFSSGIYFLRVTSNNATKNTKLVLLK